MCSSDLADIPIGTNIDILIIGSIPFYLIIVGLFKLLHKDITYKRMVTVAILMGIGVLPTEMIFTKIIKFIPGWNALAPWHALFIGFSISCLITVIVVTIIIALLSTTKTATGIDIH